MLTITSADSNDFHIIEISVHNLEADGSIKIQGRGIRLSGGYAHPIHPVSLHPTQTLEQRQAR
jgi:hypothetical protein